MYLSDKAMEMIIEKAESAWRVNDLPKSRKENYLLTLKTYLRQHGLIKNVCPECLGTGKAQSVQPVNEPDMS